MPLWAQRWLAYGSDWQVCVCVLVCMCVNMCECNGFRGYKETHLDSSSPSPTPSSIRAANSLCPQLTLTPFHSVLPNITQTPDSIKDRPPPPAPLNGQSEPNISQPQPEMSGLITRAGWSSEQSSSVRSHPDHYTPLMWRGQWRHGS